MEASNVAVAKNLYSIAKERELDMNDVRRAILDRAFEDGLISREEHESAYAWLKTTELIEKTDIAGIVWAETVKTGEVNRAVDEMEEVEPTSEEPIRVAYARILSYIATVRKARKENEN